MPTDYLETLRAIVTRLDGYKGRVDTRIDAGDEMFGGDLARYLSVTYSAI